MVDYLRVQDGVAVELWAAPENLDPVNCFPASLAETFYPAGDAKPGWIWNGSAFSAPPPAVLPTMTHYDFLGFLSLFSSSEQDAIVSSTDTRVKLFCLMAAGATFVDLTDKRVIQDTQRLEALALIGTGRAAQVLAGKAPPTA